MKIVFHSAILGGLLINSSLASPNEDGFFQSKTVIIPKDPALRNGGIGEDSADSGATVLSVADGVGAWAKKGIDPGIFARIVTKTIVDTHNQTPNMDARDLLVQGCQ